MGYKVKNTDAYDTKIEMRQCFFIVLVRLEFQAGKKIMHMELLRLLGQSLS